MIPLIRRLAPFLLILGFLAALTWAFYTFITVKYPGANDFYQRWRGARAFWVEGRDPYGQDVSRQVEIDLYGHPYDPDPALDEYPGDFLYPFHAAVLLAPLAVLPFALASAIWFTLTASAIGLAFVVSADLFNWRLPFWLLLVGVGWAATFYPSVRGIFLGQPGTLVVCLEIVTLWALAKRHDTLAGVLLAVSTIKPQLGVLIILFLLLWSVRFARWRFLRSFAFTLAMLLGASFLLLPSWLTEWLTQATQYSGYTRIGSPLWVITSYYFPFLGPVVETLLTLALLGLVLWAWMRVLWRRDMTWFDWTAALSLTVTQLILVRTATPHFVVFILVIVFYLRVLYRSTPNGKWLAVGAMIVSNVAYWWLFLATLVGKFESPAVYLPLPIGALLLLLLTQRRWQQLSPLIKTQSVSGASA